MAKRKSLLAQMYSAHKRAKLEEQRAAERARRQYDVEHRRLAVQLEKEAEQQRRADERAAQLQLKQQQQAQRAQEQAAAKAQRLAAEQEKERQRQAAAQAREHQRQLAETRRQQQEREAEERRRAVQRQVAQADHRSEAIRLQVTALDRLLQNRNRGLTRTGAQLEQVFNTQGSEAFVAALQQALATSAYPDGLHGSAAAMYRPEARELLIEYELPRQDVVPAVAAYRYVKAKNLVQPKPRKEAEIKKRYGTGI